MIQQRQNLAATALPKLHTIHALLRRRVFEGNIEAHNTTYDFSFAPSAAEIVDGRLVLTGRVGVSSARQPLRLVDGVKAHLAATQGGVGVSPVRRQLLTGTAQTAQTATAEQKLEQEKGPETELQPGLHAFESPRSDKLGRPNVESTGTLGFVGVLYLQLSLDGKALGLPLDLSNVQLGGRLAPIDDVARDLQLLFSDLVNALHGEAPDEKAAAGYVKEINQALKS